MDLKKELRIMVKYILPPEDRDNDVIENYVDTLALINEEYIKQLNIPVVTKRNWFERLPLHWRYVYYMVGGVVLGLLLPYVW